MIDAHKDEMVHRVNLGVGTSLLSGFLISVAFRYFLFWGHSTNHTCSLLASLGLDPGHSVFLSLVGIGSFLQLAALVVRRPMEKQSRRTLLLKQKRPVRRGAASPVPQPRVTPPPSGEVKNFAGQVAAGRSSSAVRKNPPDLGQKEDGKQSIVGGLMPDSENEGGQPGMLLERDEEETLSSGESSRRQEGKNPIEEKMDQSMPCLEEIETEGKEDRSPGTHSSINAEEELSNSLLLEESIVQKSTS
ncbi:hypothetical protein lerEdw1_016427, partial [Lerista edwardsae]